MMDIIERIMVEILSILAIATKEIKQGRTSELLIDKYATVNLTMVRKIYEEVNWKDRCRGCAEEA